MVGEGVISIATLDGCVHSHYVLDARHFYNSSTITNSTTGMIHFFTNGTSRGGAQDICSLENQPNNVGLTRGGSGVQGCGGAAWDGMGCSNHSRVWVTYVLCVMVNGNGMPGKDKQA